MRIMFSAYKVDPNAGSEPQFSWKWIEGAALAGNTVHVFTTEDSAIKVKNESERLGLNDLFIHVVPNPQRFKILGSEVSMYLSYLSWQRSLARYIKESKLEEVDVAHQLSWGNICLGSGFSKTEIPYVFGPAGGGTLADARLKSFFGKLWKYEFIRGHLSQILLFIPFLRQGVNRAAIILATNIETLNLAKKFGSKKSRLFLADGIDSVQISDYVTQKNNLTAIYVARFMPRKGANLAIKAFSEVLQEYPNAKLIMVGDGSEMASSVQLINKLNLQNSIELTGAISWDQVQLRYNLAQVSIFSSLRDSSGAQVLESAAKGLPIVCLETAGIVQWLPKDGCVIADVGTQSQTVQNLANAIKKVFNYSGEEWMKASESIREFALQNAWENKYPAMNDIYREILDNTQNH